MNARLLLIGLVAIAQTTLNFVDKIGLTGRNVMDLRT